MSQILDTSFLYALLTQSESRHEDVHRASANIEGTMYLPTVVMTEAAYLVQRELGAEWLAECIGILATHKCKGKD